MKKITLGLIAIFFILSANSVSASHIPGANITYTCNPNNPLQYTFTLTLFRVCPGFHPATMTAGNFNISNTCGLTNPIIPTFTQVGTPVDVNQLCPVLISNCSGGPASQPGIWMYTYQATITFPANCNSWMINFDLCCRDASTNTNGGASNNVYVETQLNTLTAPCNNSPTVTSAPIPYMCAGQTSTYCVTSADVDGDSLYYALVSPQGGTGVPITHPAPYSVTSPLQNTTFDPTTGCLTFNQPTTGNFVVTIQIQSYDAFGNLIGYVNHDYQIMVLNCSNIPPAPPTGGITNFSGSASLNGNTIDMCIGDNVCFDVVFNDINTTDSLFVTQNGTTLLPGATFTQTGSNPVTGTFCWVGTGGFSGSVVTFVAQDNACPISGQSAFAVNFNIGTGVFAGADQTICTGNNAQLQVANAVNPVWTSISGDPINVGVNISCNACPTPIITPSQTTTYVVTSDSVVGLCNLSDTVVITVLNATGPNIPDAVICPGPGNFASINVGSGYTNYTWSPACCSGQFANIFNPGTYIVSVDTLVCTLTDTFVVSLAANPLPTITGDVFFCKNENTTLGINGNYTSYTWSPNGETNSTITTGTGTYFATVIDTNGCTWNSDTVTVTNSNPQAFINNIDTVCPGDQTTINVSPSFTSYLWSNGATTQSVTVGAGNFDVIVTDNFGCNDTAFAVVPTYPTPNASFSITPDAQGQPGIPITFTDNSSGNIVAWFWSFGDGGTSSIQNPTHIYQSLGYFNVILIVENANGCRDTISREYFVISELIIPNVFTPNGDGFNDLLVIENLEFFDNNLKIYNRWGTKIFEKENYKNDWDGDSVSDGTYFFILEVKLMDDSIETHKGTISILK